MIAQYATSGAVLIVPARSAALLERVLKVDELRLRVRGQDAEIDEVLLAWRAVAAQHTEEAREQRDFRQAGSSQHEQRKPADNLGCSEVADLSGCTDRAVRLAAAQGRIVGQMVDARWIFSPECATRWAAKSKERR